MKVVVLAYHRVCPGYHIDIETFDYQMQLVRDHFVSLTLDEVAAYMCGKLHLKKDGVAITFDDGWADNFVYAYPILKKYGLRSTIFLSTGLVLDRHSLRPTLEDYWDGKISLIDLFRGGDMDTAIANLTTTGYTDDFLTWDELYRMRQGGLVEVESHGHSHEYGFCSPQLIGFCGLMPKGRESWLNLASDFQLAPGAPIYQAGGMLAHPRYYEDPDLRGHLLDIVKFYDQEEFFSQREWEKILWRSALKWRNENPGRGQMSSLESHYSWIKRDLITAELEIERHLGYHPRYLAWPFGEYNQTSIVEAEKSGIEACYTTKIGFIKASDNCYEVKRFSPPRNHSWFWAALTGELGMDIYTHAVCGFSKIQLWREGGHLRPLDVVPNEK